MPTNYQITETKLNDSSYEYEITEIVSENGQGKINGNGHGKANTEESPLTKAIREYYDGLKQKNTEEKVSVG